MLMKKENMIDFILSLTATTHDPEFRPWTAILLEIMYLLFRQRSVDDILAEGGNSSKLKNLLAVENATKAKQPTRHARFGGAFLLQTQEGTQRMTHSIPTNIGKILDSGKKAAPIYRKNQIDLPHIRPFVNHLCKLEFRQITKLALENSLIREPD